MDNTPVYTSFVVGRVVDFHAIFPGYAMPKISECIQGFDKKRLFGGFMANLVNKVVNKPFFNPEYRGDEAEIDTLRFFLSEKNVELIRKSIHELENTSIRENISINNYLGATEESALYLIREIMAMDTIGVVDSVPKTEKDFYKALLAANTLTIGKVHGDNPYPTEDKEMYLAATLASQIGSADFLYHNKQLLLLTQTVKCIRFFEYAERDEFFAPLVTDFCGKYGINAWWMFPKALWSVYGLTGGKAGIINVSNIASEEAEQYVSVIDKSSIAFDELIAKEENNDYTAFRARPLVKIAKDEYAVLNYQLLVEHIFSGLYFDFRSLAGKRGVSQSDFKRIYSTEFSEHVLFCDALKEAMGNHFEILMTEEDCLVADGSKDAQSAAPPDFYARKGNVVLVFENKDILISKELKEGGTLTQYIDYIRTRLYENEEGRPKGVKQLMNHVKKIRSGEFQKRWDVDCPQDAIVYPILLVPEAKYTYQGIKNLLQRWQKEAGVSMDNVKPIAYTDIGTFCLYQREFKNKGILPYLDEYYSQSDFARLEKSKRFDDIPNAMMSFTDYLTHTHNDTLSTFGDEWAEYIKKPSV